MRCCCALEKKAYTYKGNLDVTNLWGSEFEPINTINIAYALPRQDSYISMNHPALKRTRYQEYFFV